MRSYSGWLLLCLSIAACSSDKSGSSEDAVVAADAGDGTDSDSDKTASGSAGESADTGGRASGGEGGKSASSSAKEKSASSSNSNDKQANQANSDSKDSKDSKKDTASDAKDKSDGSASKDQAGETSDGSKTDTNNEKSAEMSLPMSGDQLSVCTRAEGDCNKGLACQGPASRFAPGRGYCSKICETDEDCSGLAPEGTKYTCSTGNGTNTCEILCSGAEDSSCPASMSCVQTGGPRQAPGRPPFDQGQGNDAGAAENPALVGSFHCRYPLAVSKIWGACGDSSHVCDQDLACAGFWFGGVGHCTHSCETDADCEKPASGSATPTCATIVPAFGQNPAVKQCALSCSDAKDGCPDGLACIEARQPTAGGGMASTPAPAWCQ